MTDETQQAVIEDNGETGWANVEPHPVLNPIWAKDLDGWPFYTSTGDNYTVEEWAKVDDAEKARAIAAADNSKEMVRRQEEYVEKERAERNNVTEAVRIVVELNASLRDDLEAAIELVDELTGRLATSRANEAFTESELLRMQARSFDVTEALKAGSVTVEIICTRCGRKEADHG